MGFLLGHSAWQIDQFPTCWPMNGLSVHWSRGWGVSSFSERLVEMLCTKCWPSALVMVLIPFPEITALPASMASLRATCYADGCRWVYRLLVQSTSIKSSLGNRGLYCWTTNCLIVWQVVVNICKHVVDNTTYSSWQCWMALKTSLCFQIIPKICIMEITSLKWRLQWNRK